MAFLLIFTIFSVIPVCAPVASGEGEGACDIKQVDINTATAAQLSKIPHITTELGKAVVSYREENGEFQAIDELLQVEGFTRALLKKVEDFLILEGFETDDCSC